MYGRMIYLFKGFFDIHIALQSQLIDMFKRDVEFLFVRCTFSTMGI
jgi:hypothetical protein